MREWPDAITVQRLLTRAGRFRRAQAILGAVALGLAIGAPVAAGLLLSGASINVAAAGMGAALLGVMTVAHFRFDFAPAAVARDVEHAAPECRNLLITAEALLRDAGPTPLPVCRIVLHEAAAMTARLDPARLFPVVPAGTRAAGAAVLAAAVFLLKVPAVEQLLPSLSTQAAAGPAVSDVRIAITPPSYSGLPSDSVVNPERVTALTGSRLDVLVSGSASAMTLETGVSTQPLARRDDGTFAGSVTVTADGFVAVTPVDNAGTAGPRRLIGLTAAPDKPPAPRVAQPGKDLFLREATATLDLGVEATDDLGLTALRLAYTKVSGVGESFTFTEGDVPLTITRTSSRQWTASGQLPLGAMGLEVGDMVVYRAVAADARPGATPVESDAFIVEIVSASEAMAEGFAIDDTKDKYAISQQMVILKTERLIARTAARPAPSRDAVLDEAMTIAAEQRSVRAELVFMMGGHFEDEFVEAAHEHEIAEGRLDNSGRADLGRAIREMSRASAELTEGNLMPALEAEKAALEAMQRALSRRRFILRTLTQRESIDDSRRLTGALADAVAWKRAVADAQASPELVALREALAVVSAAGRSQPVDADTASRLAAAAGALLKASPSNRDVVDVASALTAAAEGRQPLAPVAERIAGVLRQVMARQAVTESAETRRLKGALADVQRGGGGRD